MYPKLGVIYACIYVPLGSSSQRIVPQASSIRLSWELIRNAKPWALPQTYRIRNSGLTARKSMLEQAFHGVGQICAGVWEPLLSVIEAFWTLEKHSPTPNLSFGAFSSNPSPKCVQQNEKALLRLLPPTGPILLRKCVWIQMLFSSVTPSYLLL